MDRHRIRNLIPPVYALLILGGFLISAAVGTVVVIVGALLSGLMWSTLSGGVTNSARRPDRAAKRAARR
jgi:hypothetical protein